MRSCALLAAHPGRGGKRATGTAVGNAGHGHVLDLMYQPDVFVHQKWAEGTPPDDACWKGGSLQPCWGGMVVGWSLGWWVHLFHSLQRRFLHDKLSVVLTCSCFDLFLPLPCVPQFVALLPNPPKCQKEHAPQLVPSALPRLGALGLEGKQIVQVKWCWSLATVWETNRRASCQQLY